DIVDFALPGRRLERCLTDRYPHRIATRHLQDGRADQAIIDNYIGFDELALRLEREELRIARPRAHERDAPSRWGGGPGKGRLKLAGIGRQVAGQEGFAHRSEKETLPEGAARMAMRHGLRHTIAQSFGSRSELPESRRQHRIDTGADALAQDW